MKITGFDKLAKSAEQASRALKNFDSEIDGLEFDPTDPGSIDRAISDMEAKIDERVGSARNNPFVAPLAQVMKDAYRQKILELAAQKRMEGSNE